jgi:hypothetical protein
MNISIKNAMAGYINMWNLYHEYVQDVNTAIRWAWYRGSIYLLVMVLSMSNILMTTAGDSKLMYYYIHRIGLVRMCGNVQ